MIRLLLTSGTKVNVRNSDGRTALEVTTQWIAVVKGMSPLDEGRDLLRQAGGRPGKELDAEKPTGEALAP